MRKSINKEEKKTMDDKNLKEQMISWRHELHKIPEESMKEKKTSEYVAKQLRDMGLEVHCNVGGTGIVANLKVGTGPKVIGLRADMDALQFDEIKDLPYKSENAGWMHACGHDGHMSMLLGAAKILSEQKDFNGTVRFIFQPGEEPGWGAKAMIEDGLLVKYPMDKIFGLHNAPQFPAGTVKTRVGGAKASEDDFTIRIYGKGSHASSPHLSKDPIVIAAEIIMALQTIVSRSANPLDAVVVSCTDVKTDGIHNSIPSTVTIEGDARSFKPANQDLIESRMRKICEAVCGMYDAKCEVNYSREFIPTINDADCVQDAVKAAGTVVGKENVDGNCDPVTSSEDFAVYAAKIPGCYVFLGSGKDPDPTKNFALHNPNYDFNDDVLMTGAKYYAELAKICLV